MNHLVHTRVHQVVIVRQVRLFILLEVDSGSTMTTVKVNNIVRSKRALLTEFHRILPQDVPGRNNVTGSDGKKLSSSR